MKLCPSCRTRNKRARGICYDCGAIMDRKLLQKKMELNILNELRELNGKRPLSEDEVRMTDPIEAVKTAYEDGDITIAELEEELETEISGLAD